MNLRIEIREEESGQVIASYHSRWYGGSDIIFAEAIRIITEGMVPRFKAFQRALNKFPPCPNRIVHLDAISPQDGGRGKTEESR